jgi:glycosyltransferase involved in cell wall biosynthesis
MPLSIDFFKLFYQIKRNYDVLMFHFPFPLATFLIPFLSNKKIIIYYHSDVVRQKLSIIPFLPFIYLSLKKADKILVSGNNIIKSSYFLRKFAKKCEVLPLGIDISISESDHIESEKIKKENNKKILLGVGRLVYYKGFEFAIEAMKDVDAILIIIGEGPDKNKLTEKIKELKLEEKVFIIPPQKTLAPFLLSSDIFIFPSTEKSEAFGLVQLEAMAAGKPVINTYLGTAVEEVSLNNITGITVEPKNTTQLISAINGLLNDQNKILTFGQNAKKRYEEYYTKKIFLNNVKKILFN